MRPLPHHEYLKIYQTTGMDVDGRRAMIMHMIPCIEKAVKRFISFAKSLPGFKDLPIDDQIALIKGTVTKSVTQKMLRFIVNLLFGRSDLFFRLLRSDLLFTLWTFIIYSFKIRLVFYISKIRFTLSVKGYINYTLDTRNILFKHIKTVSLKLNVACKMKLHEFKHLPSIRQAWNWPLAFSSIF